MHVRVAGGTGTEAEWIEAHHQQQQQNKVIK
jgi:hypothetical protein